MQDISDIKTGFVYELTIDDVHEGNCFELIYGGFV